MASLTRLQWRLHRWDVYANRYQQDLNISSHGHYRAWYAVERERARRGLPSALGRGLGRCR